jgi:hypothetical protein
VIQIREDCLSSSVRSGRWDGGRTVVVDGHVGNDVDLVSTADRNLLVGGDEGVAQVGEHSNDETRIARRAKEEVKGVLEETLADRNVGRSQVDVCDFGVLL